MADWSARVDDPSVQTELRIALTSAIDELPPVPSLGRCWSCAMSRACRTSRSPKPGRYFSISRPCGGWRWLRECAVAAFTESLVTVWSRFVTARDEGIRPAGSYARAATTGLRSDHVAQCPQERHVGM